MIEVEGISKVFKKAETSKQKIYRTAPKTTFKAVDNVTFTCQLGRIYTLLGPNGAGKTTVLRIIASMLKPSGGTVRVAGIDITKDPRAARAKLGFLTGSTGLYDRLTPRETLKYFGQLHMVEASEIQSRTDELIDRLAIGEFADRRVGKLSMGQKQRVSIARTLMHDPEVIIFDEPTTGLDVLTSRTVIDWIRECRTMGKTVIFSTHIMGEVSLLSDDLGVIHNGKLCYNDSFENFKSRFGQHSLEDAFISILEDAE
ncbi:MAG: ATP-binding cassette domain-containing protein [Verrucomicrobia bacterium]|nr:ATP-binding cassette domain-containing protein [Verrucomicrobiota bacterium]